MSFATQVRGELARLYPERMCCGKAELAALLVLNTSLVNEEGQLTLAAEFENAATARKVFSLLKELYALPATVSSVEKRRFRKTRVYLVKSVLNVHNATGYFV
jgi:DNA-binding protein WhiA